MKSIGFLYLGMSKFKDHFSHNSTHYQKYRPNYPDELFSHLKSISKNHDQAWDVGTGNGQAAIKLAEHFDNVLATDPSSSQIENAIKHKAIQYQISLADNCPSEANSFDLITVAQAFHWFDFEPFFKEVSRVAKPDCILAIWTYTLASISPEIDRITNHFYSDIVGHYWPKERAHIEALYDDISIPYESVLSPKFNINLNYTMEDLIQYLGTWSAVKNYKLENQTDPLDLIRLELEQVWRDPGLERKVNWPVHLKTYCIK
jgi:ubiquinone/menaquinone biosynthesis C-methylase UbiE